MVTTVASLMFSNDPNNVKEIQLNFFHGKQYILLEISTKTKKPRENSLNNETSHETLALLPFDFTVYYHQNCIKLLVKSTQVKLHKVSKNFFIPFTWEILLSLPF